MEEEGVNSIQGKRRARIKCKISLILINPFPPSSKSSISHQ